MTKERELINEARDTLDRQTWGKMMRGRAELKKEGATWRSVLSYVKKFISDNTV